MIALACDAHQQAPSIATSPASTPPSSPAIPGPILAAMEFRRSLGLRADEAFVRELGQDKAAVERAELAGYPFPVTAPELTALRRRSENLNKVADIAEAYGLGQTADFAGGYVDTENGRYVFLAKDHVAAHREALYALLPLGSPVAVVQVRWSLVDLQPILERIRSDYPVFTADGMIAVANIVEHDNVVEIALGSNDPEADEATVLARYGNDPRIRIRITGHGLWMGAFGTVVVRITDASGRPLTPDGVACWLVADDPAAWSPGESERFPIGATCQFGHDGVETSRFRAGRGIRGRARDPGIDDFRHGGCQPKRRIWRRSRVTQ
jgi:hypothetical protein